MRELRFFGRAVPVFLAGRDNNNISWGDHLLFSLCGNNPFSECDHQDLFAVMGVEDGGDWPIISSATSAILAIPHSPLPYDKRLLALDFVD